MERSGEPQPAAHGSPGSRVVQHPDAPGSGAILQDGANNPFAKNFPLDAAAKGAAVYDPKTGEFELVDLCFSGQHGIFADDPDETLFFSMPVGVGWLKTKVWDETRTRKAQAGALPSSTTTATARLAPSPRG